MCLRLKKNEMVYHSQDIVMVPEDFPKIVCLCGSTRFKDAFVEACRAETLKGHIVLSVGMFGHSDKRLMKPCAKCDQTGDNAGWGSACPECKGTGWVFDQESPTKKMLDELHLRKIDMADEVLVIDVNSYVGESTSREIAYAQKHGKVVRYLSKE